MLTRLSFQAELGYLCGLASTSLLQPFWTAEGAAAFWMYLQEQFQKRYLDSYGPKLKGLYL